MEKRGIMRTRALGSENMAIEIARRAQRSVPAYGRLLAASGVSEIGRFELLPLTDKAGYLGPSSYGELLSEDYERAFTVFKSSGSSGQSFYWPQLKESSERTVPMMRGLLENIFRIHERRTLAIVGLALGSWIGGEHVSWSLKSLAAVSPYPFAVFSPGSVHEEIIEMIRDAEPFIDQFLIFLCPSAIRHLHLKAEERGIKLPHGRLRYMVLGEPFPESLRIGLQSASGVPESEPVIVSMYGSADTGFLGVETAATALLRQALTDDPELAEQFGVRGVVPHYFHFTASDVYLETINGELCVTRWQGIPLIRYNLHDVAELLSWEAVAGAVSQLSARFPLLAGICGDAGLPDLIAISGRSDGCLILCGTNITEAMLDEAVRTKSLAKWLTGVYKAGIKYENGRQYLEFDLEWRREAAMDAAAMDLVYALLVQELGRAQPEFLDDWRNVYRAWDGDAAKRILRFNPVRWPGMSAALEKSNKHRGIRR